MKIAYVMSRFPKVTETFILYEMLAVEARGGEVEIFPLLRHREGTRHPETERMVERARFAPFLSLRILAANWAALCDAPRDYLRLWRDVLTGTWGSMNFFVGALGILPKSVLFAREMERLGVDHVHAHFATHPAVAAFAVRRLTGIPYSFTAHGSDLHVERRMLEQKVREAALVVTVSEYNRELIVRECGEDVRDRVRVIHCGVDTDAFAPTGERHGPRPRSNGAHTRKEVERDGPFRLVCVASLEPVKGHRFLVEALRLLRDRGVPFVCDLVGDGPERRAIEASIGDAGLADRIRIRGALPRPAVISLLDRADGAVLASHPTPSGKREGIPVALMEAMASGLPVVASRVSGIPELVDDGTSGLLVPSGNPPRLAAALERMARDPGLARRMGLAGRKTVLRRFDLDRNARHLVEEIRRVGTAGSPSRLDAHPIPDPPRRSTPAAPQNARTSGRPERQTAEDRVR